MGSDINIGEIVDIFSIECDRGTHFVNAESVEPDMKGLCKYLIAEKYKMESTNKVDYHCKLTEKICVGQGSNEGNKVRDFDFDLAYKCPLCARTREKEYEIPVEKQGFLG